ncbi:hypothetical protein JCM15765_03930 [Paradesulfitobacterium aromaticivorans]
MDKRELSKLFEFKERKFRIGKFDAMTGSYIAYKLMAEVLPMGIGAKLGFSAPTGSPTMSKQDFMDLQKDCLGVCAELLPAGPTPVLNENGSWGVMDIENNAPLVMALTIQALMWNVSDFFTEDLLASLSEVLNLSLPTAKI